MVVEPLEPDSTVPLGPETATGTFCRATFSRTTLPAVAGREDEDQAVTMPTGVLAIVLSISVSEPTSCLPLLLADTSIPFPQLLIWRPMYVHPQFHS